jgi:hypothetical protein
MGQFLAIGLATKLYPRKTEVAKAQLSIEQLQNKMKEDLHFTPEIYVADETDNGISFTLKDDIFHGQLLPLLEVLYPLLYESSYYYNNVLQTLQTLPHEEWTEWSKGKSESAFQLDEYGMTDRIEEGHTSIPIFYESILLSMEGKILMEEYGKQFNFIKYTMKQAFKQFELSGALRIYITG